MTETRTTTYGEQVQAWERAGWAGILDDAGGIITRESLELADVNLDEETEESVYGWPADGMRMPWGPTFADCLTAREIELLDVSRPVSMDDVRKVRDTLATEATSA